MPEINFFKVHGLGNDFVLVDALDPPHLADLDWPSLARRACDRFTGIGADGILLLLPPAAEPPAHVRMRIFNADGSEAQMCGNGIRCIARHMAVHRGWTGRELRVQTPRGVLPITLGPDGPGFTATVDMGAPILHPSDIPVRHAGERCIDQPVTLPLDPQDRRTRAALEALGPPARPAEGGLQLRFTAVSMGNPHAVVFVRDAARLPLEALGPGLASHPLFPQKVNAQFLQVTGPAEAILRTWERGAGPTRACGTGACAALVAAATTGRLGRHAAIHLPGGSLDIRWDEPTNHVFMTGPAEEICRGTLSEPPARR